MTVRQPSQGVAAHMERQFGGGSIVFGQKRPQPSTQNAKPKTPLSDEEEELRAGQRIMAARKNQNEQFAKMSKAVKK